MGADRADSGQFGQRFRVRAHSPTLAEMERRTLTLDELATRARCSTTLLRRIIVQLEDAGRVDRVEDGYCLSARCELEFGQALRTLTPLSTPNSTAGAAWAERVA